MSSSTINALITSLLDWVKSVWVPGAVAIAGIWFGRWQALIAKEKLRHDLYDRRFAIYQAFHDLLIAVLDQPDFETELRKANMARANAPFLLEPPLVEFLQQLHDEAFRLQKTGEQIGETLDIQGMMTMNEVWSRKRRLSEQHPELIERFAPYLRLADFRAISWSGLSQSRPTKSRCSH